MFKRNFYRQVGEEQKRRGLLVGQQKLSTVRPRRLQQRAIHYYTKHRERRWWRYITLMIIVAAALLLWLLFFSPVLKIKAFAIDGLRRLPTETVRTILAGELDQRTLWVLPRDTYLTAPLKRIVARLGSMPMISSVKVERRFPGTLEVAIIERTASVVWETQGQRYEVDLNGYVAQLLDPSSTDSGLPRVVDTTDAPAVVGRLVAPPELVNLAIEGSRGAQGTRAELSRVGVDRHLLEIMTRQGWRINVTTQQEFEPQRAALEAVVAKLSEEQRDRLDYIDVTVPTLPTYKLR